MTRNLPFTSCKDVTIHSIDVWLHPNDTKFIVKSIQVIRQPTLETVYLPEASKIMMKMKINSSRVHQSLLGKEILEENIKMGKREKCFHWSLSRCSMRSLETCTHNFRCLKVSCI